MCLERGEKKGQVCFWYVTVVLFCSQLAVANNRIITLQEEMERVKEESSYILESNRKVGVCEPELNLSGSPSPNSTEKCRCLEETLFPYVSRKNCNREEGLQVGPPQR